MVFDHGFRQDCGRYVPEGNAKGEGKSMKQRGVWKKRKKKGFALKGLGQQGVKGQSQLTTPSRARGRTGTG